MGVATFPPVRRTPDPKMMSFVEHLDELRRRLVIALLCLALGSVAGWFLAPAVVHAIDAPLRASLPNGRLVVPDVYGGFTLYLKLAIIIGFVISLPITVWQAWRFVAPAFGSRANRWAPVWIVSALLLFCLGGTTGYLIIPLAINFFSGFQGADVQILPFAAEYVGFITLILTVFGISFELPLVLVSLTAAGITSSQWLARKRLHFFFGVFLFSVVATPGADWVSPLILGSILYVLFEASILVSRAIGK